MEQPTPHGQDQVIHEVRGWGVGIEGAILADWMDTVFYALGALRHGRWRLDGTRDEKTLSDIYTAINDLEHRLRPRLDGLRDALIRAHYDAGGSHTELATAMDVPRPTAQKRGNAVRRLAPPSMWEKWADGHLEPVTRTAAEVRPGWTLVVGDQYVQVSQVVVYDTGHVEIACGHVVHHYGHADEITAVPRDVPVATTTGVERIGDTSHEVTMYRRA